jgi:hypothetical protein
MCVWVLLCLVSTGGGGVCSIGQIDIDFPEQRILMPRSLGLLHSIFRAQPLKQGKAVCMPPSTESTILLQHLTGPT